MLEWFLVVKVMKKVILILRTCRVVVLLREILLLQCLLDRSRRSGRVKMCRGILLIFTVRLVWRRILMSGVDLFLLVLNLIRVM